MCPAGAENDDTQDTPNMFGHVEFALDFVGPEYFPDAEAFFTLADQGPAWVQPTRCASPIFDPIFGLMRMFTALSVLCAQVPQQTERAGPNADAIAFLGSHSI
jgi:hypothetical protein